LRAETFSRGIPVQVVVVDPSLFTLPYDRELVLGLREAGADVHFFGRPLRSNDVSPGEAAIDPHFYKLTEGWLGSHLPERPKLWLKGIDHYWSMRNFLRRVADIKPDLVHFQWLPLPLIDKAFLKSLRKICPLVLTMHDTDPFNGDPSSNLQQRDFFECVKLFDSIIVHTENAAAKVRRMGFGDDKVHVVSHGLLGPVPPYRHDAMEGPARFLLFGKIKPYKGADTLISAFGALPSDLRSQSFITIVGKPYFDLSVLHKQAEALGVSDRLEITADFVPDSMLDELFGPNTIAVFPYREIEASGVLMLALAYGRPIIASNLGSFAETLEDGASGLLAPPGDIPALTEAMERMLRDRAFAAACGYRARQIVESVPSWREIGARTLDVYRSARR
jgi:glycosyltransferase involved in cell wall biosynthesis